jgi:putative GTP pyrophosphokinase
VPFVSPGKYSKATLDRAGESIRQNGGTLDDILMLENWRASHLHVINTFQSSLRQRKKRRGSNVTIVQRLKRRPTIIDKLSRESGMSLSRMHDIAGCRLIFDSIDDLRSFRKGVLESRSSHELVGGGRRYDYIEDPKPSGYRGVHDVYKYQVLSGTGQKWNGLRIELQYRTYTQHAWATAVEISDIVNSTRLKFSDASRDISRLFVLASEILARGRERVLGSCADTPTRQILEEFDALEHRMHAVARLRGLTSTAFRRFAVSSRFFILVNYIDGEFSGTTEAQGFSDSKMALETYSKLEKDLQSVADVVLVGAGEQDAIKLAYTNYFSDASMFIQELDSSIAVLRRDILG